MIPLLDSAFGSEFVGDGRSGRFVEEALSPRRTDAWRLPRPTRTAADSPSTQAMLDGVEC
jgi:hypothetical protein